MSGRVGGWTGRLELCVCVHMWKRGWVGVCGCGCECLCACMCVHVRACEGGRVCAAECVLAHVCVCVCVCTLMCSCMCVCVCVCLGGGQSVLVCLFDLACRILKAEKSLKAFMAQHNTALWKDSKSLM